MYEELIEKIPKPEESHIRLVEVKDLYVHSLQRSCKTMFINIPKTDDPNKIEGLHSYLVRIKPVLIELGIEGIAYRPKDSLS